MQLPSIQPTQMNTSVGQAQLPVEKYGATGKALAGLGEVGFQLAEKFAAIRKQDKINELHTTEKSKALTEYTHKFEELKLKSSESGFLFETDASGQMVLDKDGKPIETMDTVADGMLMFSKDYEDATEESLSNFTPEYRGPVRDFLTALTQDTMLKAEDFSMTKQRANFDNVETQRADVAIRDVKQLPPNAKDRFEFLSKKRALQFEGIKKKVGTVITMEQAQKLLRKLDNDMARGFMDVSGLHLNSAIHGVQSRQLFYDTLFDPRNAEIAETVINTWMQGKEEEFKTAEPSMTPEQRMEAGKPSAKAYTEAEKEFNKPTTEVKKELYKDDADVLKGLNDALKGKKERDNYIVPESILKDATKRIKRNPASLTKEEVVKLFQKNGVPIKYSVNPSVIQYDKNWAVNFKDQLGVQGSSKPTGSNWIRDALSPDQIHDYMRMYLNSLARGQEERKRNLGVEANDYKARAEVGSPGNLEYISEEGIKLAKAADELLPPIEAKRFKSSMMISEGTGFFKERAATLPKAARDDIAQNRTEELFKPVFERWGIDNKKTFMGAELEAMKKANLNASESLQRDLQEDGAEYAFTYDEATKEALKTGSMEQAISASMLFQNKMGILEQNIRTLPKMIIKDYITQYKEATNYDYNTAFGVVKKLQGEVGRFSPEVYREMGAINDSVANELGFLMMVTSPDSAKAVIDIRKKSRDSAANGTDPIKTLQESLPKGEPLPAILNTLESNDPNAKTLFKWFAETSPGTNAFLRGTIRDGVALEMLKGTEGEEAITKVATPILSNWKFSSDGKLFIPQSSKKNIAEVQSFTKRFLTTEKLKPFRVKPPKIFEDQMKKRGKDPEKAFKEFLMKGDNSIFIPSADQTRMLWKFKQADGSYTEVIEPRGNSYSIPIDRMSATGDISEE